MNSYMAHSIEADLIRFNGPYILTQWNTTVPDKGAFWLEIELGEIVVAGIKKLHY